MKVSHNWLQTYFKEKLPKADELAELFAMHAFEVEGVEKVGEDFVLDIKILPDRAHYDLSHKGIADEVSFLTKLVVNNRYVDELPATLDDKPIVKVENALFCRRYTARFVEVKSHLADVNKSGGTSESPSWLANPLETIGQRSISPLVDVSNYVMYDIGQPLHAFDADKVKGPIVIRSAKNGEKIVLLDGREITLTSADNVIADDEGALVIAGAKGGKRAEVTETTKRILIESANFEPIAVRRTSTKYDIRSDSSKRFENEITPELAIHGMNNICGLIKEMYPDALFGPIVDEYPVKAKQTVIEFNPTYIEERLGIKVPPDEAKSILESMNIEVKEEKDVWHLTIPFGRLDLNIREDVVEEIGRVYGYDKIKGILPPNTDTPPYMLPIYYISEKVRNILVAAGFSEVSLYTLVEKGDIEILKPLAKDKAFVRNTLVDGMNEAVHKNALNAHLLGLESIKIFEIGHVFDLEGERTMLAIGAEQVKKIKGQKGADIISDAIQKLEQGLGVELKVTSSDKTGNSKSDNNSAVSVIEINLDEIATKIKDQNIFGDDVPSSGISSNRYKKFSLFPFITRDIAVFVPESVSAEEVWSVIEKGINDAGADGLLARHSLFDTFKKENKTSYAFRMVYQAPDKTLTDEEINKVMEVINTMMKDNKWEVR